MNIRTHIMNNIMWEGVEEPTIPPQTLLCRPSVERKEQLVGKLADP